MGIADDKQGIAVVLHALAMLKAMHFRDYGTATVIINGDEEVSSPPSPSGAWLNSPVRAPLDKRSASSYHCWSPTHPSKPCLLRAI